jgi:hypothetical protein
VSQHPRARRNASIHKQNERLNSAGVSGGARLPENTRILFSCPSVRPIDLMTHSAAVALGKLMASGMSRKDVSHANSTISCDDTTASGSPVLMQCCTCSRASHKPAAPQRGHQRTIATRATMWPGSHPIMRSRTHARADLKRVTLNRCKHEHLICLHAIKNRVQAMNGSKPLAIQCDTRSFEQAAWEEKARAGAGKEI